MATATPNHILLNQLRTGSAHFEIVSSPSTSITSIIHPFQNIRNSPLFFARIVGPPLPTPAKKTEHYRVEKVAGDGRCMFRALVKGMARNKGISLSSRQERDDADELRIAVKEVICENPEERRQFQDAVVAITVDEPLKRYCQRIGQPDFWGGESELLVLSKLCRQPIIVYVPESEGRRSGGSGFIPVAEYGAEHRSGLGKTQQPRQVVRLLYSGGNHYDLLVS